jgi:hypothetical protein
MQAVASTWQVAAPCAAGGRTGRTDARGLARSVPTTARPALLARERGKRSSRRRATRHGGTGTVQQRLWPLPVRRAPPLAFVAVPVPVPADDGRISGLKLRAYTVNFGLEEKKSVLACFN